MFVRTKRFKGKEYAYLVENKWTKRGTRQKAIKYLGKVITPSIREIFDEENVPYCDLEEVRRTKSYKEALKKILYFEVQRLIFNDDENISINVNKQEVLCDDKRCVLKLKEGFFCGYTLKRLFNLHYFGQDKLEFGYKLAEGFLICGISLDKELFVEICNKAFSEYENKPVVKKSSG